MSFLCNLAAGQHTPKSILESSQPRDVTLAPALGRARESSGGLGMTPATLANTVGTIATTLANTLAFPGV